MLSCWQLDLAVALGAFGYEKLHSVLWYFGRGYISSQTALRLVELDEDSLRAHKRSMMGGL